MPIPPKTVVIAKDYDEQVSPKLRLDAQGQKMTLDRVNFIKGLVEEHWNEYPDKRQLADRIEHGLIFGEFAHNEHYLVKDLMVIIKMVEAEKVKEAEPIEPKIEP